MGVAEGLSNRVVFEAGKKVPIESAILIHFLTRSQRHIIRVNRVNEGPASLPQSRVAETTTPFNT